MELVTLAEKSTVKQSNRQDRGKDQEMVRIVVHLPDRALVSQLAHATKYEPVSVNREKGILAFDVPYGRVEAVLNRLAKNCAGEFMARLTETPESHASEGQEGCG